MKRRPAVRRGNQAGHELGADRSRNAWPPGKRLAPRLVYVVNKPVQATPELQGCCELLQAMAATVVSLGQAYRSWRSPSALRVIGLAGTVASGTSLPLPVSYRMLCKIAS